MPCTAKKDKALRPELSGDLDPLAPAFASLLSDVKSLLIQLHTIRLPFKHHRESKMDNEKKVMRWQDWGNLILGAWLLFSYLFLPYPGDIPYAQWSSTILGIAIMLFSMIAMYVPKVWEEAINLLIGIWLIAAPWILKFQNDEKIMVNSILVGALVVVLSLWAIWRDASVAAWRQSHAAN